MFKDDADFKKVVGRLKVDTEPNPKHRENLRRQVLCEFEQAGQKPATRIIAFRTLRRTIMKSPITKLATAVVIILVVLVGINYLGGSINGTSAAFGKVVEYLRNAETVSLRVTIEQEGQEPQTMYYWTLEPNHQRIEMEDGRIVIVDTYLGESIVLDPAQKKAYLMTTVVSPEYSLNYYDNIKKDLLENFPNSSEEYIGESEIDGHKVVGIRVNRDDCEIIIWADVVNFMPVKIESAGVFRREQYTNQKSRAVTCTITDIVIGEKLDESLFSLSPPEGFLVVVTSEPAAEPQREIMQGLSAQIILKLAKACHNYSKDHSGLWPENLHQAIEYGIEDNALSNLADPESELGCVYIRPTKSDPRCVLLYQAYDVWPEGGIIVSFTDCLVMIIKDEATFNEHLEYTLEQQNQ